MSSPQYGIHHSELWKNKKTLTKTSTIVVYNHSNRQDQFWPKLEKHNMFSPPYLIHHVEFYKTSRTIFIYVPKK